MSDCCSHSTQLIFETVVQTLYQVIHVNISFPSFFLQFVSVFLLSDPNLDSNTYEEP